MLLSAVLNRSTVSAEIGFDASVSRLAFGALFVALSDFDSDRCRLSDRASSTDRHVKNMNAATVPKRNAPRQIAKFNSRRRVIFMQFVSFTK
jgi:hypothetical protein